MVPSRELLLPKEFPYLGHKDHTYRVIEQAEDCVRIERDDGTPVRVPLANVIRCHDALMAAPERILRMQSIPAGRPGESVVAATLVAAGLARVVNEDPIELLGI